MAAARVVRTALPPVRAAAGRHAFPQQLAPSRAATAPARTTAAAASPVAASAATLRPFHVHTRQTAFPLPSRPTRAAQNGSPSFAAAAAADAPAAPAAAATTTAAETGSLPDVPPPSDPNAPPIDWSSSFHGLSTLPFDRAAAAVLTAPVDPLDVEIKPDGILYLPEIKYRRILNQAFGPGGWGLAPRGELSVGDKVVTREYALVAQGRFVGQARGECAFFGQGEDGVATAAEGAKSNALMRCCKDLGVASELWDPRFIRTFKAKHCREVWVEHVTTKKRRQIWLRKDCPPAYPYAAVSGYASSGSGSTTAAKTTAR